MDPAFFFFFSLQEIHDARRIRNQILSNFELALQPGIDEEEAEHLLHVVIVGGGPTGVEFGAELYDFIEQVCITDTDDPRRGREGWGLMCSFLFFKDGVCALCVCVCVRMHVCVVCACVHACTCIWVCMLA